LRARSEQTRLPTISLKIALVRSHTSRHTAPHYGSQFKLKFEIRATGGLQTAECPSSP
jgi:hypothetical protein